MGAPTRRPPPKRPDLPHHLLGTQTWKARAGDLSKGERGRARGARYVPNASRASCPAEGTMVGEAGGGRRALRPLACLASLPECASGGARRAAGEKGAGGRASGQGRPPARAGGRTGWRREDRAQLCWHQPRAEMEGKGRRPPSPLRHSATTLPPAPMGVPPGGHRRRGRSEHQALPGRDRKGGTAPGVPPSPRRASPTPQRQAGQAWKQPGAGLSRPSARALGRVRGDPGGAGLPTRGAQAALDSRGRSGVARARLTCRRDPAAPRACSRFLAGFRDLPPSQGDCYKCTRTVG